MILIKVLAPSGQRVKELLLCMLCMWKKVWWNLRDRMRTLLSGIIPFKYLT